MPGKRQEQHRTTRTQWAGAGLVISAGVGATVGVLVAGGAGIALGAAFGGALGLVAGAVVDLWTKRR